MEPTRREFVQTTATMAASSICGASGAAADAPSPTPHPLLTPADKFKDVSRGNPKPFTLKGDALAAARLTPETWRL